MLICIAYILYSRGGVRGFLSEIDAEMVCVLPPAPGVAALPAAKLCPLHARPLWRETALLSSRTTPAVPAARRPLPIRCRSDEGNNPLPQQ